MRHRPIISVLLCLAVVACDESSLAPDPAAHIDLSTVASCESCHTNYAALIRLADPDTTPRREGAAGKRRVSSPMTGCSWAAPGTRNSRVRRTAASSAWCVMLG
jgi:hypothetical protein